MAFLVRVMQTQCVRLEGVLEESAVAALRKTIANLARRVLKRLWGWFVRLRGCRESLCNKAFVHRGGPGHLGLAPRHFNEILENFARF